MVLVAIQAGMRVIVVDTDRYGDHPRSLAAAIKLCGLSMWQLRRQRYLAESCSTTVVKPLHSFDIAPSRHTHA